MNKQSLSELLDEIAEDAVTASNAVQDGLMTRVRDGMHGHPRSPSFEAGQGAMPPEDLPDHLRGRLEHADPTGTAAVQAVDHGDQAETDRRQLIRDAKAARLAIARFVRTAARYNPRRPSAFDQTQASQDVEPGCVSCARITGPNGPWWNQATRTTTLVSGEVVLLCEWCYRTPHVGAQFTGQLPAKEEVMHYRDHGRARRRTA